MKLNGQQCHADDHWHPATFGWSGFSNNARSPEHQPEQNKQFDVIDGTWLQFEFIFSSLVTFLWRFPSGKSHHSPNNTLSREFSCKILWFRIFESSHCQRAHYLMFCLRFWSSYFDSDVCSYSALTPASRLAICIDSIEQSPPRRMNGSHSIPIHLLGISRVIMANWKLPQPIWWMAFKSPQRTK